MLSVLTISCAGFNINNVTHSVVLILISTVIQCHFCWFRHYHFCTNSCAPYGFKSVTQSVVLVLILTLKMSVVLVLILTL